MALERYLKVKGKPGLPVANPWSIGARPFPRFAGKQRDPALDGEPEHLDRYRDVEEVLPSHNDLLKACARGELELLGKCEASSADEARVKMSADKDDDQ
jgi:hypothetical protein